MLHGVLLDGTVRVSTDASQAQHLLVDVNDLTVDETTAVHGVLDVTLSPNLDGKARPFSLRLVEPFALKDHGGVDGDFPRPLGLRAGKGLSCGEELDLDVLDVDRKSVV